MSVWLDACADAMLTTNDLIGMETRHICTWCGVFMLATKRSGYHNCNKKTNFSDFFIRLSYIHTKRDRQRIWTEALSLSSPFPRWQISAYYLNMKNMYVILKCFLFVYPEKKKKKKKKKNRKKRFLLVCANCQIKRWFPWIINSISWKKVNNMNLSSAKFVQRVLKLNISRCHVSYFLQPENIVIMLIVFCKIFLLLHVLIHIV